MSASARKAMTAVEGLVCVACVGLLVALMAPSLDRTRQKGRSAVCLGNLGRLGMASLFYAAEDAHELIVPMHKAYVLALSYSGWQGPWNWRTAFPHVFGGRAAVTPFPTGGGEITVLMEGSPHEGMWGEAARPLNNYVIYADSASSAGRKAFHCPADTGYPEVAADWGYIPPQAADIPCFDFLGNSYRYNTIGAVWTSGGVGGPDPRVRGRLASGPEGHSLSWIESAERVVLYCDPLFYGMARGLGGVDVDPIVGWHGQLGAENVAYCDGSARMTEVGEIYEFSQEELDEMNYTPDFPEHYFLRRGPTWQLDCYPSPGALIQVFYPNGTSALPAAALEGLTGWPFDGYTTNECPF